VSGWTKLFSSIVTSSVWCEDDATVRVWIAMLATADSDGLVEGSVPGFANLARVPVAKMRAALVKLSSPDPDSRTPDHEGRRIETIEGGWQILNYAAYREKPQDKEGSKAPAMRRYRARKRAEVTTGNPLPGALTSYPEERREKREVETERRNVTPADLPADIQAEKSIREARWKSERRLYAAVKAISDATDIEAREVMLTVTKYRRRDGTVVEGRVRPELLSEERVEKSLEDALAWMGDLGLVEVPA
jgi:hypothetical protein